MNDMGNNESRQMSLCERRKHCMCTANFLLVSTVVMQFVALSEQSSSVMPSSEALSFFNIAYMLGLFIPGPVGAFLVDKYRRQNVYRVSLIAMVVATALMYFDKSVEVVALVRFLEGMMFGLAQVTLGSTLLNDLSVSESRTSSDYSFAWSALIAVPCGAGLGYFLMEEFNFNVMLLCGIAMLAASVALVSSLKVPFRAPIHPGIFGLDRFWQKNDFVPFINLLLISIPAGVVIMAFGSWLFWAFAAAGAITANVVRKAVFRNADMRAEIVSGLLCAFFALLIIIVRDADTYYKVASFMFGAGISLASTRFLLYFLKLTGHCQRGTAQNTYMLSRECGYALGLVLALMIPVALETALVLILLSVALYLFVTHPWFMRHGDRGFKFREV